MVNKDIHKGHAKNTGFTVLCRWPSIAEWEMHITTQGPRLHYIEWDVKLYYTIRYPGSADNNELKIEKITDV